jgi:hypothetical protein
LSTLGTVELGPRLSHGIRGFCTAHQGERDNWRLIGSSEGIHCPDLDEDLGIDSLICGRPSGESQESLKRWLEKCNSRTKRARPSRGGRNFNAQRRTARKAQLR